MKKILGLIFSLRKLGNSEILVKEIMGSIPEPCTLEMLRMPDLQLKPCNACYRCLQPDAACPLDDDFNFIMEKVKAADALILGVPVYILGTPAMYKMLTDRLVGTGNYFEHTRGKPCLIVMPYGTQGWEGYARMAALVMPRMLQMKVVECWQVLATLPGESLVNRDNLHYAQGLGAALFRGREYQPGARDCQVCGSDLLRLLPGGKILCPICGAEGILKADGIPDFSAATYNRFGHEEMEEHFMIWLVNMKQKFRDVKDQLKELQAGYREKDWWIKP